MQNRNISYALHFSVKFYFLMKQTQALPKAGLE